MLALNSLRKGHKYRVKNFGDTYEFEIIDILNHNDFLLKDLHTFEVFRYSVIIDYGLGGDYTIEEL